MEQHDFGATAQLPAFFGGGSGGGADDALEGSPSYGASPNYSSSLDGPPGPFDGGSQDPGSTEELLLDLDAARRYLDVLEDTPADARDAREPSEMTVAPKRPKWIPGEGMSAAEEKRCPSCRQMVGRAHFSNRAWKHAHGLCEPCWKASQAHLQARNSEQSGPQAQEERDPANLIKEPRVQAAYRAIMMSHLDAYMADEISEAQLATRKQAAKDEAIAMYPANPGTGAQQKPLLEQLLKWTAEGRLGADNQKPTEDVVACLHRKAVAVAARMQAYIAHAHPNGLLTSQLAQFYDAVDASPEPVVSGLPRGMIGMLVKNWRHPGLNKKGLQPFVREFAEFLRLESQTLPGSRGLPNNEQLIKAQPMGMAASSQGRVGFPTIQAPPPALLPLPSLGSLGPKKRTREGEVPSSSTSNIWAFSNAEHCS